MLGAQKMTATSKKKPPEDEMTALPGWHLRATITRWEDDHFPGFIECRFTDRFGQEWVIIDKVPALTSDHVTSNGPFPTPILIDCKVMMWFQDSAGQRYGLIALVHVETTDGMSVFEVSGDQLIEAGRSDSAPPA
jgi:hypothetical protein